MAIGLEAKGYRGSETRAENVTGIALRVAKRDERAQELSHKAAPHTNVIVKLKVFPHLLTCKLLLMLEADLFSFH
jgi:hypothetical protein